MKTKTEISPVMHELATYISRAIKRPLPKPVAEKTKHHVLDTLAAMVSGSRLLPGEKAISYIKTQGGVAESTVVASRVVTTAQNAALANGMLAHADETDDSHAPSLTHRAAASCRPRSRWRSASKATALRSCEPSHLVTT